MFGGRGDATGSLSCSACGWRPLLPCFGRSPPACWLPLSGCRVGSAGQGRGSRQRSGPRERGTWWEDLGSLWWAGCHRQRLAGLGRAVGGLAEALEDVTEGAWCRVPEAAGSHGGGQSPPAVGGPRKRCAGRTVIPAALREPLPPSPREGRAVRAPPKASPQEAAGRHLQAQRRPLLPSRDEAAETTCSGAPGRKQL